MTKEQLLGRLEVDANLWAGLEAMANETGKIRKVHKMKDGEKVVIWELK